MTRSRIWPALAVLSLAIAGTLPVMAAPYLQGPISRSIKAATIGSVLQVQQSQQEQQEFIREVQESLQTLGLYRGAIDGIWGPGSQLGLDEFMRLAGYRGDFNEAVHEHLSWAAYIRAFETYLSNSQSGKLQI